MDISRRGNVHNTRIYLYRYRDDTQTHISEPGQTNREKKKTQNNKNKTCRGTTAELQYFTYTNIILYYYHPSGIPILL